MCGEWLPLSHSQLRVKGLFYVCYILCSSAMAKDMLKVLEDTLENQLKQPKVFQYAEALQEGVRPKQYLPLMSRTKCGM